MRCFSCHRPLLRCAVPGLQIGPKCARDRGLMPERIRRHRVIEPHRINTDPRQIDWVNNVNAGVAGGSAIV